LVQQQESCFGISPSIFHAVSVARRSFHAVGELSSNKGETRMIRLPNWLVMVLALALLVSLTTPALAAEAMGKIKSVTADKHGLVVTDNDGKNWNFQMNEDAEIRLADKDIKLADLKVGDEVTVTYERKNGRLLVSKIRCERK
jgi:Cu/Ag efflux protein CusF